MKTTAVRLYGKNDLRLESFELPALKDDEILVKIISDSICMSTYKATIQGSDHKRVPKDMLPYTSYGMRRRAPNIPRAASSASTSSSSRLSAAPRAARGSAARPPVARRGITCCGGSSRTRATSRPRTTRGSNMTRWPCIPTAASTRARFRPPIWMMRPRA